MFPYRRRVLTIFFVGMNPGNLTTSLPSTNNIPRRVAKGKISILDPTLPTFSRVAFKRHLHAD
jgi:hypothetical protein